MSVGLLMDLLYAMGVIDYICCFCRLVVVVTSEVILQSSGESGLSRRLEQRLKEPGERAMLTVASSPNPTRRGRSVAKGQRRRKRP